MNVTWVAWLIFAALIAAMFILCFVVGKIYIVKDKEQYERFPFFVAVLALTVTSLCVFLVPVDVFNVSTMTDPKTGFLAADVTIDGAAARGFAVKLIYYILYGVLFVFAFLVIPFTYFFYEEGDSETTFRQRIRRSLFYTAFFLLFIIIFLVIGLFFRPVPDDSWSKSSASDWVRRLFDTRNAGDGAILFCLAVLTLVGLIIWCTYSGMGLAILPIRMLAISEKAQLSNDEIDTQLIVNREQTRAVEAKYARPADRAHMSTKEIRAYYQARKREAELSQQRADRANPVAPAMNPCLAQALAPIRLVLGVIFALLSLLLVISIVLTSCDKAFNQWASWMTDRPKIPNPIDLALVGLSRVFPLDYVFLGIIILYVFLASLAGFIHVGIRCLWFKLFSIKRNKTQPQALLIMAGLMMFVMLSLNVEFGTLAPQYTTFGSQVYYNGSTTAQECSLSAITNTSCIMSQLGTMQSRINLSMPFFSTVYFFSNFVFIAAAIVGIPVAICCCKKKPKRIAEGEGEEAPIDDVDMA